ncbi:MAG: type II toxin-antitoxin system VapC family toxin [Nitrospiraceae bacterium]
MKVMLDTNICIYLIKQRPPSLIERLQAEPVADLGISSVTLAELEFGVAKSQHVVQNRIALNKFLEPLEIAPFDRKASLAYGKIRHLLERAGTPIGSMDFLIAAHALSLGVRLVTNNTKEFQRVAGLRVENWV